MGRKHRCLRIRNHLDKNFLTKENWILLFWTAWELLFKSAKNQFFWIFLLPAEDSIGLTLVARSTEDSTKHRDGKTGIQIYLRLKSRPLVRFESRHAWLKLSNPTGPWIWGYPSSFLSSVDAATLELFSHFLHVLNTLIHFPHFQNPLHLLDSSLKIKLILHLYAFQANFSGFWCVDVLFSLDRNCTSIHEKNPGIYMRKN